MCRGADPLIGMREDRKPKKKGKILTLLASIFLFLLFYSSYKAYAVTNDNLYWSPQIIFQLSDYDTYIKFNDWTYIDSFNIDTANINFTALRLVKTSPLDQIGFDVQDGNLTIKESGSNQLTLETQGETSTTTTVKVYCFALGEPSSVTGDTSHSYANEVLTFTVLHPPSPPSDVIIIWEGTQNFIDQYFPLMLFIVGFVCFFLPLGIIFWRRPDPATCIKLIMISFIGFAVLMFSGSA